MFQETVLDLLFSSILRIFKYGGIFPVDMAPRRLYLPEVDIIALILCAIQFRISKCKSKKYE